MSASSSQLPVSSLWLLIKSWKLAADSWKL